MSGDLEERLRGVRSRMRVPLAPDGGALLDMLIAIGLARFGTEDAPDRRTDEALDNFRRLIDDITQQARILRLDTIPAPGLVRALERLCPLWPWCA